ncbi:Asp-tRNA(Asn)/Glu-tRNA(Gln) amidotransferase subunit GatB [Candidatus Parcubacteria bacterium]|nr:MAG: Asp-tRNA(Asn)/Glu-tRNA(Gln) amidotransferase subunit GatB [Candidatus Parcubacteria bacterium]
MLKPTIGLEIHSELKTKTKMFCGCLNDPDEKHPNTNICPICMAHPGTLPVANQTAIESVVRVGLALNCEIAQFSKFDRKNYFYPDLPKGYQISQYDLPFCKRGYLKIGENKINITRVHLEEDTARLQHDPKGNAALVDFNRAGVPLMELVTEPDIVSGKQAREFAQELQLILRYLGVSDADMEKGQMRVEVNISLAKGGERGTKVEIKNLNSLRSVEKSVDYEIRRQSELIGEGKKINQETRGWDESKQETISQRSKEEAQDYRYFPEPDLPPVTFTQEQIEKLKSTIPELPQQKRTRFSKEYNLPENDITVLVSDKELSGYFEDVVSELLGWFKDENKKVSEEERLKAFKLTANYLISDLQSLLSAGGFLMKDLKITAENFAEFIKLIFEGKITSRVAKDILAEMFNSGADPSVLIEKGGLSQVSDETELEKIIKDVILQNPKPAEDYKKGKEESLQFLVGQVMKATKGKANPEKTASILKNII